MCFISNSLFSCSIDAFPFSFFFFGDFHSFAFCSHFIDWYVNGHQLPLSLDDLKEALQRRGPDSLGSKRLLLHSKSSSLINKQETVTSIEEEVTIDTENSFSAEESFSGSFQNGETPVEEKTFGIHSFVGELLFLGATLQLRGVSPIVQPLVDKFGNILVYNGASILTCMDMMQRLLHAYLISSDNRHRDYLLDALNVFVMHSGQWLA